MNDKFTDAYLDTVNPPSRFEELKNRFSVVSDDPEQIRRDIIEMLTISYVDEWLAEMNYFASYNLSKTEGKVDYDPEFQQHEKEEYDHRHDFANRLRELGAQVPTIPIDQFVYVNSRGTNWKQELSDISVEQLKNRFVEENEAIEWYTLCVEYTRHTNDHTTYTLFKKVKADEEQHRLDLGDLGVQSGVFKKDILSMPANGDIDPTLHIASQELDKGL